MSHESNLRLIKKKIDFDLMGQISSTMSLLHLRIYISLWFSSSVSNRLLERFSQHSTVNWPVCPSGYPLWMFQLWTLLWGLRRRPHMTRLKLPSSKCFWISLSSVFMSIVSCYHWVISSVTTGSNFYLSLLLLGRNLRESSRASWDSPRMMLFQQTLLVIAGE